MQKLNNSYKIHIIYMNYEQIKINLKNALTNGIKCFIITLELLVIANFVTLGFNQLAV